MTPVKYLGESEGSGLEGDWKGKAAANDTGDGSLISPRPLPTRGLALFRYCRGWVAGGRYNLSPCSRGKTSAPSRSSTIYKEAKVERLVIHSIISSLAE